MENDSLPPAAGQGPVILSAETYEAIRRALGGGMWFDPRDFVETVRDGKKMVRLQPRAGGAGGGVGGSGVLPFQISVTEDSLVAAAGTLDGDAIAETTEASPANGTWYLEATVEINATTGVVTDTEVDWVSSETTDTTTDFHFTIGTVTVSGGVPDATSIVQAAYGPILAIVHGEVDDKWGVLIF